MSSGRLPESDTDWIEVSDFIILHALLFEITQGRISLCIDHIQRIGISAGRLIKEVTLAAKYRPTRVSLFSDLLMQLCPPDLVAKTLLAPHVDNVEFLCESDRVHLAFVCFERGFLHINQIAECCSSLLASPGRFSTLVFIWFAPELESSHCQLYTEMFGMFESVWEFEYNSGFLYDVYDQFSRFKIDGWRLLRERRTSCGAFLRAIMNDNIDELQSLVSVGGFKMNQRILRDAFEWRILHRDYPTLIHVAAFYGAIRCFRYLLLNDADLLLSDFRGKSVAEYAVAGGSTEIVRILDERQCPLDGCLAAAALFHRNEIVDWFIGRDESLLETEAVLTQSVISGNFHSLMCCVERGISVNAVDGDVSFQFSEFSCPKLDRPSFLRKI
jgi:hypothetical protein